MKEISINVAVYLDMDYLADTELCIKVSDDVYAKLAELTDKISDEEMEDSDAEEFIEENAPDIYKTLTQAVDDQMPDNIEMEDGEDIDDYSWCPNFAMISLN